MNVDVQGEKLIVTAPGDSFGALRRLQTHLNSERTFFTDFEELIVPAAYVLELLSIADRLGIAIALTEAAQQEIPTTVNIARQIKTVSTEATTAVRNGRRRLDEQLTSVGFARPLIDHQVERLSCLTRMTGRGLDASTPGAGKTATALASWSLLRAEHPGLKLVIVAPKSAHETWELEAAECFASELAPRFAVIGRDQPNFSFDAILCTYERVSSPDFRQTLAFFLHEKNFYLVVDEAHFAKNPHSQRGQALRNLATKSYSTIALTGTPMTQTPADLERVLDLPFPGCGTSLVRGSLSTCRDSALQRVRKDQLGIPELEIVEERVELSGLHRELYDAAVDDARAVVTAEEAQLQELAEVFARVLVLSTSPKQALQPNTPWTPTVSVEKWQHLDEIVASNGTDVVEVKLVRLRQLVVDEVSNGGKVVVWVNYRANIAAAEAALQDFNPAVIHGGIPVWAPTGAVSRETELTRFRNAPDCPVLIASPLTLGTGLSLHKTTQYQIHLDRTFGLAPYLQSLDRTHRLGIDPDSTPKAILLVARNTLDQRVSAILQRKAAALGNLLSDPNLRPISMPEVESFDPAGEFLRDKESLAQLFEGLTEGRTIRTN